MTAILNGAPTKIDGSISVVVGTLAPERVENGVPYDGSSVAIDTVSPIAHYHHGLPFTSAGRIVAATGTDPDRIAGGATPYCPTGWCSPRLPPPVRKTDLTTGWGTIRVVVSLAPHKHHDIGDASHG